MAIQCQQKSNAYSDDVRLLTYPVEHDRLVHKPLLRLKGFATRQTIFTVGSILPTNRISL